MLEVTPAVTMKGVGLWTAYLSGFGLLWYGVGYLFGDTDLHRTPAQNFVRRAFSWLRWAGAVANGLSYAVEAGLYGYHLAMRRPLPNLRSERLRPPVALSTLSHRSTPGDLYGETPKPEQIA